ncbi:MAG TPA: endopeptidase La, partial [Firmicutes bacterium]|nr:endopeptidase La [Bacillota bacterium]
LVEGISRGRIISYREQDSIFEVEVLEVKRKARQSKTTDALVRNLISQFEIYVDLSQKIPKEITANLKSIDDPGTLADEISGHLFLKTDQKQKLLEASDPEKQINLLLQFISSENEILKIEQKIQNDIKNKLEKSQKEFYLTEQLKAIQKELGEKDVFTQEINELSKSIKDSKMSKEAEDKALHELSRLKYMSPMSPEATVVRTYIDWLISLPWVFRTSDLLDIKKARKILDEDHYSLDKIKERIIEYLAVRKLTNSMKGPILCFVGPPGVGKTSLAKSIARAMGRKFVRISLGGVRDEAEIRGHRRTYIGALPGKIIQAMRKAKSKNPIFLMDEVDKMSSDFRGDPSSALLEVLDPEQNFSFNDHYLDTDFDLSEVMFITTANIVYNIPPPLRDRMEVLSIAGYTEQEKLGIAKNFLIPKQLVEHGLKKSNITFSDEAVYTIIQVYTMEAGVRNLERSIATICRKVATEIAQNSKQGLINISKKNIQKYLGVPTIWHPTAGKVDEVGVATGLAWTEVGGEILLVETTIMKGKGQIILTGQLGEVMQESAQAAISYIRSQAKKYNLDEDFLKNKDLHIHVPEGAVPKDGPSAGVTIATSILSALTKNKVKCEVAMTGELTLRGKVIPIGGLKEKLLAAYRENIKTVIIPKENENALKEIPVNLKKKFKIILVSNVEEVFRDAIIFNKPDRKPKKGAAKKNTKQAKVRKKPR